MWVKGSKLDSARNSRLIVFEEFLLLTWLDVCLVHEKEVNYEIEAYYEFAPSVYVKPDEQNSKSSKCQGIE